ncbi:MAG: T9SS type A sorting domain-containing protein, partial [Bacteroidales bacterium]|nr:T9SS type A sorting domain-containing protein [Bacteroidales bacterium]
FVHWNDSVTDNPRIIVLTQDTLFTAYFDTIGDSTISIVEAEMIENLFTLSPNPTAKDLQIHLNRSGNYTMVIYTSAGVEIKKQPISEPTTINCTELTPGTYIIKIYNDECAGVKSFVKQ